MMPIFFSSPTEFRQWLEQNHQTEKELIVGYHKVSTGKPSMTWSESVDVALCFGWIDGVRRSLGEDSYCIRFTPRRPDSIWSAVNIRKMQELIEKGLMTPAGLAVFDKRKPEKSQVYTFENEPTILAEHLEAIFQANAAAWDFFKAQPPSYKKTIIGWIMAAKQESTRIKRLERAIAESAQRRRIR